MLQCLYGGGLGQAANASSRGHRWVPSGALRVRVYAGLDPILKRRMYLTEVVPAGPKAGDQAERTHPAAEPGGSEAKPRAATVGQLLVSTLLSPFAAVRLCRTSQPPPPKDPGEPDTRPTDPPAVKPEINNQWLSPTQP